MSLKGFFSGNEIVNKIPLYISPRCGVCQLDHKVTSPKIQLDGEGRKKILVVGEAPGENEDLEGKPFVGKSGQFLERALRDLGVDFRKDCWITNAVRCRPWRWNNTKTKKENRPPADKEIIYCRPFLTGNGDPYGEIKKYNPETILLLGAPAVKSVIGWLWKEDPGGVNRWVGYKIPCQKLNCWVCVAWHPSFVDREESQKNKAIELIWKDHLKEVFSLRGRPFKEVPNYKSHVTVEMVPMQAAHLVREVTRMGKLTSVDIETDRRKPDCKDSSIWSCAVSNGVITVSFLWQGEAIQATRELLTSGVPITCHAIKFESRWFESKGIKIKNLAFCSMTAAHILDNRPGVTGLKFQSFVLLGQESYDDLVKPYFSDDDEPNKPNLIKKLDKRTLLLYGGLDALLGLLVAKKQITQLGLEID